MLLLQVAIAILAACVSVTVAQQGECKNNGHLSLIVDGVSGSYGGRFLAQIGDKPATFMLSTHCLSNRNTLNLIRRDKIPGHHFGYRTSHPDESKIRQMSDKNIEDELERARSRFKKELKRDLRYVLFPFSEDEELMERLARIADKVNMVPVGYNLYLQSKATKATDEIADRITDSETQSFIALIDGHTDHKETLKFLEKHLSQKEFKFVSHNECLGLEDEPVAGASKNKAHGGKRSDAKQDKSKSKSKKHDKSKIRALAKKIDLAQISGFTDEVEHHKHQKKHMLAVSETTIDGLDKVHHKHSKHGKHGKHGKHAHDSHKSKDKLHQKSAAMMRQRQFKNAGDPDKIVGKAGADKKSADKKPTSKKPEDAKKTPDSKKPEDAKKATDQKAPSEPDNKNAALPSTVISLSTLAAIFAVTTFILL